MQLFRSIRRQAPRISYAAVLTSGCLTAVLGGLVENRLSGEISGSYFFITVVVVLTLVVVVGYQVRLWEVVGRLDRRSGFRMAYYPGTTRAELEELHRAASKIIRDAPADAKIYAVNSYLEVFRDSHNPDTFQAQRRYLAAYEERFGSVESYHRLIQLKNGLDRRNHDAPLAELLAPPYLEHFQAIVEFRAEKPHQEVKIEEVQARFPTSFVVVKHGCGGDIIWQMNQHAPTTRDPDSLRMEGVFLIHDPDGVLVPRFLWWFFTLDAGRSEQLTAADLAP
jgi:hypothetical protein